MTRDQIIGAFRLRAHDSAQPPLWSNDELEEYLDDAHNEAAERALLLRDSTTSDICEIAIVAAPAEYELDGRIIEVLRAKLDSQTRPLVLTTTEALDIDWPGWGDAPAGEPTRLVIDPQGAAWLGRLVPPPSTATMLRLHVLRFPLEPISATGEPEIHPRLHIRLVDWMLYRAYSKKDTETSDEKKAAEHADDFTAAFGPKRDAKTAMAQHDRQFPVVRPTGL